jgi:hypothetical protein
MRHTAAKELVRARPRSGDFVSEPMSEKLGRLPRVAIWIVMANRKLRGRRDG